MKLDLTQDLKNINDDFFKDAEGKDIPLADFLKIALLHVYSEDAKITGVDKFKRFKIAEKIAEAKDEVSLSIEELAIVKDLVGKCFGAAIVGPIWKALERPPTAKIKPVDLPEGLVHTPATIAPPA